MSTYTSQAIEILQHTHDGEDLSPGDLYLVECAVNNRLGVEGAGLFDALYRRVGAGTYHRPWLHGVENLTIRHNGDVYWRDVPFENFTYWNEAARARLEMHAKEIGRVFSAYEQAHGAVDREVAVTLDHLAGDAARERWTRENSNERVVVTR